MPHQIPVIDLFSGPGGLSEGLSRCGCGAVSDRGVREKDAAAHQTLEQRAFFRQAPRGEAVVEYYRHLQNACEATRAELFTAYPAAAAAARREAWQAELGVVSEPELDQRIAAAT